ncbi:calexcitin-2-like [Colias croceus]|uniref:calexcitin-2-like n=1 Tax=Colias crocea TaxID=72248 RepID=UPI001E27AE8A|nr:calexcitin-2-like [Colias croceus]
MVSEFRKQKLLHVFKIFFNADASSVIEKKDFEDSLKRIVQLQGWKEGDIIYSMAQDIMLQIWDGFQAADANSDGKVTAEEWIAMWDNQDKTDFPEWQKLFCRVCFHIKDSSADGSLDAAEFIRVLKNAFGVSNDDAKLAYEKVSQGKSGVSWEDYQQLFKEFFIADDVNAPGNYIFGAAPFLK